MDTHNLRIGEEIMRLTGAGHLYLVKLKEFWVCFHRRSILDSCRLPLFFLLISLYWTVQNLLDITMSIKTSKSYTTKTSQSTAASYETNVGCLLVKPSLALILFFSDFLPKVGNTPTTASNPNETRQRSFSHHSELHEATVHLS
jgi:hypothetical protein